MSAEREPVTVLLVHADPVVHELVAGTLGDEFKVLTASSASRGMALFERHLPAVVVIDSTVGDANCEDVFEAMRASEPGLRAVFLADQDDPQRVLRLGDLGIVLPRRRDLERLRIAVRNAAKFRALSEEVARLKSDAQRASTTTSKRRRDEGADDAPLSRRGPPTPLPPLGEAEAPTSMGPRAAPNPGPSPAPKSRPPAGAASRRGKR